MHATKQNLAKKFPVASEILRQLGGGKVLVMTGAKAIFGKNNLTLLLGTKCLQIKLNSADLYNIIYVTATPQKANKPIAEMKDIYYENLVETCEQMTGLYFRLLRT